MKIVKTGSQVSKFFISNEKCELPLTCREDQAFALSFPMKELEDKFSALVQIKIYMTNIDTDFIMDASIDTMFLFEINTLAPTKQDVYDLYCEANSECNKIVSYRANKSGVTIDVGWDIAPYDIVETSISEALKILISE